MSLVFLDCHLDAVLQDLFGGGVLETEGTFDHLVGVGQFAGGESVFVAGLSRGYNSLVSGE